VAEIESGPKTAPVPDTATVTADEKRREGDRLRKQKQRERERDQDTAHIDNKPGGQPQPPKDKPSRNPFAGLRNSWAKKIGEPVGPTEARRQLWHIHVGVARIIRSKAKLEEQEFEEAGNAFEEVSNHWLPWLRIVLRLGAPLILLGALWGIWAHILSETEWLQSWLERRRGQVVEADFQPVVAKSPMGGGGVTPEPPDLNQDQAAEVVHPPMINMNRLRGR